MQNAIIWPGFTIFLIICHPLNRIQVLLSRIGFKDAVFRGLCILNRARCKFRRRQLIIYYHWPDFARKAEAIADLFRRRGIHAELRNGLAFRMRVLLKSSPDLWVGFWNEVPTTLLPKSYIFLNAEPLSIRRWNENTDWADAMRNAKQVWSYTRSNAAYIQEHDVPFHFVPYGYAPYYESSFRRHNDGKNLPQDIDVLFFGHVSERRQRILGKLKQRGIIVHVVNRANPSYGEELDELLSRTKIVLGIHQFDEPQAQIADFARIDHLLSNRLFVLHERPSSEASDPDPAFERHVATCEYQEIPDTCDYFLARPAERAAKARQAHDWFKSERALDSFIPYDEVKMLLGQK